MADARHALAAAGALAGALLAAAPAAHAYAPTAGRRLTAETLTALPAAGLRAPLRVEPALRPGAPAAAQAPAWARLVGDLGGGRWEATWDVATGVPSRIWGAGLPAPGTAAATPEGAAAAAALARRLLAAHLALLAPGAAPADLELVSNRLDGAVRAVGFVQRAGGRRVVGGQVSFRFAHDRLVAIGSEALPHVAAAQPRARLARGPLAARATAAVAAALELASADAEAPGEEVVLPLVGDAAVLGYRVATPVVIAAGAEGRVLAYADPSTGEVLAVHQQARFATGTVAIRAVDRNPMRPRVDRPAPRARVTVGGAAQTTTDAGLVTWPGAGPVDVVAGVVGDLATIVNKAPMGRAASATLSVPPGGAAAWDASAVVEDDAQVQTYLAINLAKAYVRTFDPALPLLDAQLTGNVNIAMDCNAFFDGTAINFFHASARCQNTGLLTDVIFHEFGHAVHANEIVPGVGAFDGAMSEGAADFLAALITGDHGMGRGFFYDDAPLRDLDPVGSENVWPRDIGEIHYTGQIFGGAFWDLRTALVAALGEGPGVALTQRLYVGALRRATSIPTSLIEVLVEDDDDGDLANGTPHECEIRAAFGRHGLRTASGTIEAPGAVTLPARATTVTVRVAGLSSRCAGDELAGVDLSWRPGRSGAPAAGHAAATLVPFTAATYAATLPLPADDVLTYRAVATFTDGSTLSLPDNLGDGAYQLYQGDTVALYCTDFEGGSPFDAGWTTGVAGGGASPWAWGAPGGGATDPPAAFGGARILALGLGEDYAPGLDAWVRSPVVDVGRYTDVHLQYRRWLAVEDSHFDQATIAVNGHRAWVNVTANAGDNSATHAIDREWRFHDVALSNYAFERQLQVEWRLKSDEGLELGGWQLDDVCVVANRRSVCGDGVRTGRELCDDGAANARRPDACRPDCTVPRCGDAVVDEPEECDAGPTGDATCTDKCFLVAPPGGGCAAGGAAGWAPGLALAVWAARRRRRAP